MFDGLLSTEWLAVIAITSVVMVSPGPDFLMVTRNALRDGRGVGVATGFGVGAGLALHVAAALLGVSVVITASTLAFTALKVAGGLYLIWIGMKALRSRGTNDFPAPDAGRPADGLWAGFRMGAITNATNPKAVIFILSLFAATISPETPLTTRLAYGAFIAGAHIAWFSAVALLFGEARVRRAFLRASCAIDRAFGAILVFFGGAILATAAPNR